MTPTLVAARSRDEPGHSTSRSSSQVGPTTSAATARTRSASSRSAVTTEVHDLGLEWSEWSEWALMQDPFGNGFYLIGHPLD